MTPEQRLRKQAADRLYSERKKVRDAEALEKLQRHRQRQVETNREWRRKKKLEAARTTPKSKITIMPGSEKTTKPGQLLPGSLSDPTRWQSMTKAEYDRLNPKRPVTGSGYLGQFKHHANRLERQAS